jgi:hypothetical protein
MTEDFAVLADPIPEIPPVISHENGSFSSWGHGPNWPDSPSDASAGVSVMVTYQISKNKTPEQGTNGDYG